jgi:hypothetical protein
VSKRCRGFDALDFGEQRRDVAECESSKQRRTFCDSFLRGSDVEEVWGGISHKVCGFDIRSLHPGWGQAESPFYRNSYSGLGRSLMIPVQALLHIYHHRTCIPLETQL